MALRGGMGPGGGGAGDRQRVPQAPDPPGAAQIDRCACDRAPIEAGVMQQIGEAKRDRLFCAMEVLAALGEPSQRGAGAT